MEFDIVPAAAADAPDIARLLGQLEHPVDARDVPGRLAAVVADGGAVLLATASDSTPVGLIALSRHATLHAAGPIAYITALVTDVHARRTGVGRALVAAAVRWAVAGGCVRLSVTSAERRTGAHAFYVASGLPYTGRRFSATLTNPERSRRHA